MTEEEKNKTDDQPLDDLLSCGQALCRLERGTHIPCVKNGVSKEGNRARAPEKEEPGMKLAKEDE